MIDIKELTTDFLSALTDKLTTVSFSKKQVDWLVESLREIGISLVSGAILNALIGDMNYLLFILLLILSTYLWYISYKLLQVYD